MPQGDNPFAAAAKRAAEQTNAELGGELSKLTRLTDKELERLFPEHADKERLAQLLEIVNSATSENEKALRLKKNIDGLAAVAIRLVKTLAVG